MRSLADFEFNKAPLCEGMILACEAIRRDFPSQDVYDELERLVSLAKEEVLTGVVESCLGGADVEETLAAAKDEIEAIGK